MKKYRIVEGYTDTIAEEVEELMADGWELAELVVEDTTLGDTRAYQSMTKEVSGENSSPDTN